MATKFIQKAIKHPGALRKELGIKEGKTIPAKKLAAAAKKPGKLGQRARFAETLKGFKKWVIPKKTLPFTLQSVMSAIGRSQICWKKAIDAWPRSSIWSMLWWWWSCLGQGLRHRSFIKFLGCKNWSIHPCRSGNFGV